MAEKKKKTGNRARNNPARKNLQKTGYFREEETRKAVYFALAASLVIAALTAYQLDRNSLIPTEFLRHTVFEITMLFPVVVIILFGVIAGTGVQSDSGFIAVSFLLHFAAIFVITRAYFLKPAEKKKKYLALLLAALAIYLIAAEMYLG